MHEADKIQEIFLKLERIELQVGRLVSDAESEKELRKDRNKETDRRLSEIEKWQAKWGGALIALGIIATIISIVTAFIKLKT